MREILFRGKRKDNKEWIEGCYIESVAKNSPFAYITPSYPSEPIRVYSKTVGQYTGLTDKNGKKIFEGDICQHRSYYSDNIVISVVTYTDGQFLAMVDENSGFNLSDKLEIIGNIHDNPELLKGGASDA